MTNTKAAASEETGEAKFAPGPTDKPGLYVTSSLHRRQWERDLAERDQWRDQAATWKGERDGARALLAELMKRLDDEADITNGGGPNLAMRLSVEFGDRLRAAIAKAVSP